jgi:serine/threonine protein phosphatase 1
LIYAIGDIHGQHKMLLELLRIIRERPLRDEDELVFLGDYIDRGEDSRAVLETLIDLQKQRENVVFLRGNHEQLMLDARDGPPPEPAEQPGYVIHSPQMLNWLQNGGVDTLLNYDVADFSCWWESIPQSHWQFIRDTHLEHIAEKYHFVHAGLLPPGKTWEGDFWERHVDPRLWIREPFLSSRHTFDGRIVVFGHTPQRNGRPLISRNKIGLDTGAVFGGPLTAAVFTPHTPGQRMPGPEFLQAPFIKE